jgi:DNA helicase-2/ATP-dependent DNA helicase PcrA
MSPSDSPFEDAYEPPALRVSDLARADVRPAEYLDGLNAEQRAAVEATEGPVLVLAGAGTGKTRVLTTRLAHILATGRARPWELLAVTFTNKAAREMRERITHIIGPQAEGLRWLGTFHSVAAQILRKHAELVGLKSNYTILDQDDQERLIKQVLEAENLDAKRWPPKMLAGLIDHWKNRGWTPAALPPAESAQFANGKGQAMYRLYQERLRILNACDFGDLLLHNISIFTGNPDVLTEYHERFRYLLVDEYQDTNVAQYLWLRLLAQGSPNLCCVGDDDQSIYGWRGAEVDNILRFEKDFPGAKVIRLERNYRSTGHILAAASHLIAHNEGRLGKTLRSEGEEGEKVAVISAWDSEEEARSIGEEIEELQRAGHSLDEIAILVRASFQMREFEDRFVTLGLSYRVIGGPRFYERAEIRDALAYLRLVNQPADDLAFERIVNVPKRGLGDATVNILHDVARRQGVPLLEATRRIVATDELKPKPRQALRDLVEAFDRWRIQRDAVPHNRLAEIILDESGYTEMWQKDRSADAAGRLENLKELVRSMEEFENLQGFLEHISLVMDTDRGDGGEAVSIMTLHAAKGLEFDTVFLPGWEEGVIPSQRTLDENGRAGLEEERRLAHVGITRARKRARIFFVANRRIHGSWSSALPSRFIDELPVASVEVAESKGGFGNFAGYGGHGSRFDRAESFGSSYATPGWRRAQRRNRGGFDEDVADFDDGFAEDRARYSQDEQQPAASHRAARGSGFAPDAKRSRLPLTIEGELIAKSTGTVSPYAIGDRVFHLKFGNGNVTHVDGNKLTIAFDRAGEKRVVDSFVERV